MNVAAEELTGWQSEDVEGRHFCYQLFQCENERGKRLRNGCCPGVAAFTARQPHNEAAYVITRKDGEKVKVKSDYRFIHEPVDGHRIGLIRMEPVVEAQTSAQPTNGRGLWQAVVAAVLAIALLVALTPLIERANHTWMTLGQVEQVAVDQPTPFKFTYPATGKPGVAFLTAERGKPVEALEGSCPYDGEAVQWNAQKGEFICPEDGSAFARDGAFKSGNAGFRLRHLRATLTDTGEVRAWIPNAPVTPVKDRPAFDDVYVMPVF
jgi:PAS domain-containing protein